MSAKRTAMRKLREVLRLSYSAGLSIRKISASTKISVGSIQNILKLAEQLKITWPLPEDWDDQTLALKFYPRSDAQPSAKFQEPVWTDVHMELKKKGLTKQLLWEEYTQQYPNRCYSYSQFCARYAELAEETKTLHAAVPIVPVKSCLSIMPVPRCPWFAPQPAKYARRKSLWRCWAPPITPLPKRPGAKACRIG